MWNGSTQILPVRFDITSFRLGEDQRRHSKLVDADPSYGVER